MRNGDMMNGQIVSAAEGFAIFMESLQMPRPQHGEAEINALLQYAHRQRKGDWFAYADCKRRLSKLNVTCEQYQQAHRQLIDILRV